MIGPPSQVTGPPRAQSVPPQWTPFSLPRGTSSALPPGTTVSGAERSTGAYVFNGGGGGDTEASLGGELQQAAARTGGSTEVRQLAGHERRESVHEAMEEGGVCGSTGGAELYYYLID
jgi:hypothetical protein